MKTIEQAASDYAECDSSALPICKPCIKEHHLIDSIHTSDVENCIHKERRKAFIAGARWMVENRARKTQNEGLEEILQKSLKACGISFDAFKNRKIKIREVTDCRKLYAYLALRDTDFSPTIISRYVGHTCSNILKHYRTALQLVEANDFRFVEILSSIDED